MKYRRRRRKSPPGDAASSNHVSTTLRTAVELHQSGRLREAEIAYRNVLVGNPNNPDALHLLGLITHQAGRLDEAVVLIEKAISRASGAARYHNNLGLVLDDLGRLHDAELSCRRALALAPDYAEAHVTLGIVLQKQGNLDDACRHFEHAIADKPNLSGAHNNLANTLRQKGAIEDAIASYRSALAIDPKFVDALFNLGGLLVQIGEADEAEQLFRRALAVDPDAARVQLALGALLNDQERAGEAEIYFRRATEADEFAARAHIGLGLTLWGMGRAEAAEASCRQAIALAPNDASAKNALGLSLYDQARATEAVDLFRQAIELDPGDAAIHNNLGNALKDLGKFDESEACYRQAVSLKPDYATAYYNLADLRHIDANDPARNILEALVEDKNWPLQERINLAFARSKFHADAGRYDDAFDACRRGNELCVSRAERAGVQFDAALHSDWVNRIIGHFTEQYFATTRCHGVASGRPVFIVGMPRSGTTLVEQILASHPDVSGAGELPDIDRMAMGMDRGLGPSAEYPECVDRLDQSACRRLGESYLDRLRAVSSDALRVTDKSPTNFLYLGLVARILPEAQIIHCRRNALDTCLSCYFKNFPQGNEFTNDLADLASFYADYQRLMAHWRKVLPIAILDVDYEALVRTPEPVIREMVLSLGLEWHPQCLEFYRTERAIHTASNVQVRQKLFSNSIDRWRVYEKHLGALIDALGTAAEHNP